MASELSFFTADPIRFACGMLARKSRLVLECDRVVLWRYSPDGNTLTTDVIVGRGSNKTVSIPVEIGIPGVCVSSSSVVNVADVHSNAHFDKDQAEEVVGFEYHIQSVLCAPLYAYADSHRTVIGVLEAVNKIRGSQFTAADESAISDFASDIALSLQPDRRSLLTGMGQQGSHYTEASTLPASPGLTSVLHGLSSRHSSSLLPRHNLAMPPPLELAAPTALDLMVPDEVVERLFDRYDLDHSGTINDVEQLKQLSLSLIISCKIKLSLQNLNEEFEKAVLMLEAAPMQLPDFRTWWAECIVPHCNDRRPG